MVKNIEMCKHFVLALLCIHVHCVTSDISFIAVNIEHYKTCNVTAFDVLDILACARLCRNTMSCNAIEAKTTDIGHIACFILASEHFAGAANGTVYMTTVRSETMSTLAIKSIM